MCRVLVMCCLEAEVCSGMLSLEVINSGVLWSMVSSAVLATRKWSRLVLNVSGKFLIMGCCRGGFCGKRLGAALCWTQPVPNGSNRPKLNPSATCVTPLWKDISGRVGNAGLRHGERGTKRRNAKIREGGGSPWQSTYPLQPVEDPCWSSSKVWEGRSSKEEPLRTEHDPHTPLHHSELGGRGV